MRKWVWLALLLINPASFGQDLRPRLFVSNEKSNSILVYDLAAQGDEPPLRRIFGFRTQLDQPQQLAVHEGELFVCSADSVLVFDLQGEGNLPPLRQLTVDHARGVAVHRDELFVTSQDAILVFALKAEKDAKPRRRIQGSDTKMKGPHGLLVYNGQIVVADEPTDQLLGFDLKAHGNVAPTGFWRAWRPRLWRPRGIVEWQNRFYVAGDGGNMTVLDATRPEEQSPPLHYFALSLNGPVGLTRWQSELFVANKLDNSTVVTSSESGPLRKISGGHTRLSMPTGVAVALSR